MLFLGRPHTGVVVMRQRTALKEMFLKIKADLGLAQQEPNVPLAVL